MRLREHDLEWREVEGEILVLDRRRGSYFAVAGAGAVMWSALARETTQEAVVARVIDSYGIEPARARADVNEFLTWLAGRELLMR